MLRREIRNYPFLFFMSLKSAFEMKKGVMVNLGAIELTKKYAMQIEKYIE